MSERRKGAERFMLIARFTNGHKYFIDRTSGRIAVADQSGYYPDATDDDVLWLALDRPLVEVKSRGGWPTVSVPLTAPYGGDYTTTAVESEAEWLRDLWNGQLRLARPITHKG